jgi:predicted nucleic acid-binding protein
LSGFLLDTCAISEVAKPKPNAGLSTWLQTVNPLEVYISVVTMGEIRQGIESCTDSARKASLEAWITNEFSQMFAGRILDFDSCVADRWGRLIAALKRAAVNPSPIDSLIAATALEHNLSVVTRNEKHFAPMGSGVTNPWS